MFDLYILLTAVFLLALDFIYLNAMSNYFKNQVKIVQKTPLKINYLGVILCYILLIIGLYYFIIKRNKSVFDAFLFGLVIYGVYETTTLGLFTNWSFTTVVLDTLWGASLFAITTYLVYKVKKNILE
jgi:uncharacterized membrane protein